MKLSPSLPLPPRPKSIDEENEDEIPYEAEILSEKTLQEQEAGHYSLEFFRNKQNAEFEAGRKTVEKNRQRAAKKTIDSEKS